MLASFSDLTSASLVLSSERFVSSSSSIDSRRRSIAYGMHISTSARPCQMATACSRQPS